MACDAVPCDPAVRRGGPPGASAGRRSPPGVAHPDPVRARAAEPRGTAPRPREASLPRSARGGGRTGPRTSMRSQAEEHGHVAYQVVGVAGARRTPDAGLGTGAAPGPRGEQGAPFGGAGPRGPRPGGPPAGPAPSLLLLIPRLRSSPGSPGFPCLSSAEVPAEERIAGRHRSGAPCRRFRGRPPLRDLHSLVPAGGLHPCGYSTVRLGTGTHSCAPAPTSSAAGRPPRRGCADGLSAPADTVPTWHGLR